MAKKKATKAAPSPDTGLTDEQQQARDEGIDAAPPEPPREVSKGELVDAVLHGGLEWPRGTKVSDLRPKLDDEDKARLTRLGLIAGTAESDE